MKSRSFLVVLIILLSFLFTGCIEEINEDQLLDDEFDRIKLAIPSDFNSDVFLPTVEEGFDVEYVLDNETLTDEVINFRQQENDKHLILEIVLTYGETTNTYYYQMKQLGHNVSNELTEFEEIVVLIQYQVPDKIYSNTNLPVVENNEVYISYEVDCSEIVRDRIVYTFPDIDEECNLVTEVIIDGEMQSFLVPFVMSSVNTLPRVPQIHIDTDSSIDSNEIYTPGTVTVTGDSNPLFQEIIDANVGVKLRGNSTLWMPKQSYRIKFESKTRLLSPYAEKDWVLLANFTDQTLVRNYTAFNMANKLEMDFVPMYRFIDLYINGEYLGNYLLSDNIEVSNDRVNVQEDSFLQDTGYLIEMDIGLYRVGLEESGENYFLLDWIPFVIKSPQEDSLYYREHHKTYISDYMEDLLLTLSKGEDYNDLIDEDTFVDWFIVNELYKNVDSGYSSVYFYKEAGGKLKMGPVWDFDLSTGNQGHVDSDSRGPEGWYTSRQDKNIFFYYLMQYDSFRDALKNRWNEVYDDIIITVLDDIFKAADSISHSRYNNFERWDIIGSNSSWYTAPEIYDLKTYDEQVWFLYDYLVERIDWMDEEINDF